MKKKVSKTITGKSKALKQKVKQVVNVNIHTGKRSAGRTQKPTPKPPFMSPSFNPVIQPSLSSNIDILTLANLLRQPVKLPLVETSEINKLAPEEIRQKRIDNLEKELQPKSPEKVLQPKLPGEIDNLEPKHKRGRKKGSKNKPKPAPVSAESITQAEEALPALNVIGSEMPIRVKKKPKSQLRIEEAEEDKQTKISDFFDPNFNEKEK